MPFLTIAGITVQVAADSASEEAPFELGHLVESFDGSLINTLRAEKRRWSFGSIEMAEADYQTLRAAVALGTEVAVDGDAIDGGPIDAVVRLQSGPYVRDGNGFKRSISLRVMEA